MSDSNAFQQALVPVIGLCVGNAFLSWFTQWCQRTSGKRGVAQLQHDVLQQLISTGFDRDYISKTPGRSKDNSLLWWHSQLVHKYPLILDWLLVGCISQNLIMICVLFAGIVVSLYECWKLTLVTLSVVLSILALATAIKRYGACNYHLPYKEFQDETDKKNHHSAAWIAVLLY
ncbi:hypothetical protein BC941DRAFT_409862 [Chlamydoabsidia padenii]|nr:hypothetical protein BC941DRAFT_409862 [Chlamydoabsidia padenii]